jgi:hypothetical protein
MEAIRGIGFSFFIGGGPLIRVSVIRGSTVVQTPFFFKSGNPLLRVFDLEQFCLRSLRKILAIRKIHPNFTAVLQLA